MNTGRINTLNRYSFRKGMPRSAHIEFREVRTGYRGENVEVVQTWTLGNKMTLRQRHLAHKARHPKDRSLDHLL